MSTPNVVKLDKPRLSTGVRAITVVICLTVIALVADHAYFVAPHHAQASSNIVAAHELPVSVQVDGFALPESLRPTAGDVTPPPASF